MRATPLLKCKKGKKCLALSKWQIQLRLRGPEWCTTWISQCHTILPWPLIGIKVLGWPTCGQTPNTINYLWGIWAVCVQKDILKCKNKRMTWSPHRIKNRKIRKIWCSRVTILENSTTHCLNGMVLYFILVLLSKIVYVLQLEPLGICVLVVYECLFGYSQLLLLTHSKKSSVNLRC